MVEALLSRLWGKSAEAKCLRPAAVHEIHVFKPSSSRYVARQAHQPLDRLQQEASGSFPFFWTARG